LVHSTTTASLMESPRVGTCCTTSLKEREKSIED
jgi:hypothetical protein